MRSRLLWLSHFAALQHGTVALSAFWIMIHALLT